MEENLLTVDGNTFHHCEHHITEDEEDDGEVHCAGLIMFVTAVIAQTCKTAVRYGMELLLFHEEERKYVSTKASYYCLDCSC